MERQRSDVTKPVSYRAWTEHQFLSRTQVLSVFIDTDFKFLIWILKVGYWLPQVSFFWFPQLLVLALPHWSISQPTSQPGYPMRSPVLNPLPQSTISDAGKMVINGDPKSLPGS